ncbi:hypothetical protein U9M48_011353 [Paspalum notatum var. saurae]|uniref:GDSL esterase/lipase n=1 Tax=Paspalum notatum var. saurae TaxID=547442 RepID=A0AAQ3WH26_PASNO
MMPKVVSELASVVSELQDIGVSKVMVNTLQPFGCSAWQARRRNYESCNDDGNALSDKHNTELRDRLGDDDDDVMLLDLNSVFMDMVAPRQEGSTLAAQFTERLRPCCEGVGDDGYCGLDQQFTLCDRPDQYFYWDDFYPTHAGWRAVMRILQGPIMAFLGISNLNHF